MKPVLLDRDQSQLVVIDVQEKLANVMPDEIASVVRHIGILMEASKRLSIPMIVTEQYPKGLGSTVKSLEPYLQSHKVIEKTQFSGMAVPAFRQQLSSDFGQIVLVGMESHICVLQTAIDLLNEGKTVFVVSDAVISRTSTNRMNALLRLRQAGAIITNTESVVFEWLREAKGDDFKALSQLIK
jgi:nicotinamidase-related amidase